MFLALITKTPDGYAGLVPELTVLANGNTQEEVEQALSEGIALHLIENPELKGAARQLSDLPTEVQADYAGQEVVEKVLFPAPVNQLSLALDRAIEASGLSYRELAKRLGTGHAAISRLTDPFYWGHSMPTLRKVADAIGAQLKVEITPAA